MIRKSKKFNRPRKAFELTRIKEENELVKKFALKSKREIWKTLAKVTYFRHRAKDLAKKTPEEQEILFNKLKALGLKADSISDVLGLKVEDILNRRLPTVVYKKGLANTPQQARQMVVHKRILIESKVVNVPSYLVPISLEEKIALKQKIKKAKEVPAEQTQGESQ